MKEGSKASVKEIQLYLTLPLTLMLFFSFIIIIIIIIFIIIIFIITIILLLLLLLLFFNDPSRESSYEGGGVYNVEWTCCIQDLIIVCSLCCLCTK